MTDGGVGSGALLGPFAWVCGAPSGANTESKHGAQDRTYRDYGQHHWRHVTDVSKEVANAPICHEWPIRPLREKCGNQTDSSKKDRQRNGAPTRNRSPDDSWKARGDDNRVKPLALERSDAPIPER